MKVDDFEKRLRKLGRDVQGQWLPPFIKQNANEQETAEWKKLFREENLRMRRLVRQPMGSVEERAREAFEIREPMLQFERRMRQKYPSMPKTLNEQTAEDINRARNDPEYREREGLNQKEPYD